MGKIETLPITDRIRAILEPLAGHNPDMVFTYMAQRDREGRKRGQRYPLTYNGAMSAFRRAKERARKQTMDKTTLVKFGFHSLRRDRATAVYKATKDVVAVNRLLVHGDIQTTMRYLEIDTDDVRRAMEKTDLPQEVPMPGHHTNETKVA